MRRIGPALVAGLAILPGAMAVCIAYFYLGDWPTANPFDHVFYGACAGVAFWIIVSIAFLRGFADVETADVATYDELVVRSASLKARLDALSCPEERPTHTNPATVVLPESGELATSLAEMRALLVRIAEAVTTSRQEGARSLQATRAAAFAEARQLLGGLQQALAGRSAGSAIRWSGASGYISLWRQLHRAEEALLAAESRETLYAEAIDDEARLEKTKVDGADALLGELRRYLGDPAKRRPRAECLAELDQPEGRTFLREIRFVLDSYRDDLFQRFVRIRNAMFATLVYVGLVGDGVLALAIVVLPRAFEPAIVAGMTYYLIGALVGLFAELYGAQKGHRGAVHDYGLALVRLLTIPVLSGIAAVLGVVLTRLGGAGSTGEVSFEQIFSLTNYPLGVVVAAIFGLTPGLLLERLRAQTNEYKDELVKSSAGTPSASAEASS